MSTILIEKSLGMLALEAAILSRKDGFARSYSDSNSSEDDPRP